MASTTDGRRGAVAVAAAAALFLNLPGAGAAIWRDAAGREVEVAERPQRIVSLAPNLTEILFDLGLGGRVAGVTLFCDWPPEAAQKPKVGGFINPSLEAIVALEPDLVLATADGNRESDVLRLESLSIPVYVTDSRSLADVVESVRAVGRLTGREGEARRLVAEMEARIGRVREAVGGAPVRRVFVALDTRPLVTAGRGTFVDELVTAAGGRNVVDSDVMKYPVYGLESLLAADPEVVVVATGGAGPDLDPLAVLERARTHVVEEGDFFRPGPRIVDSLERLARIIHPEVFR